MPVENSAFNGCGIGCHTPNDSPTRFVKLTLLKLEKYADSMKQDRNDPEIRKCIELKYQMSE